MHAHLHRLGKIGCPDDDRNLVARRRPAQGGDGLQPNDTTANRLLRTCVELGQLEVGREIRRCLRSLNLQLDSAVGQQLDAPTPTKR